ncbi:MAG: GAF domain-containing protein, partial [Bacteroidia bacterium]
MNSYLSIIQAFTRSLTDAKSVEVVCWELTKNVIAHMGFEDCVVYLFDDDRQVLIQIAAHGPKNPVDLDILNPIVIHPGEGIVGSVFLSGQPEIIPDTSIDWRYIVDDKRRMSEICVPILYQGKAIGVIDSENSEKNFYTADHLLILSTLASNSSNKIIKTRAFEKLENLNAALENQLRNNEEQTKELRRLNKQLDELIYRLSHDFRTPVIGVLGLLELLQHDPSKINMLLDNLRRNMQRLDSILQNIYFYSLNLRKPIEKESVNLRDVFEETYKQLNHPNKKDAIFKINQRIENNVYTDAARLKIFARHVIQNS